MRRLKALKFLHLSRVLRLLLLQRQVLRLLVLHGNVLLLHHVGCMGVLRCAPSAVHHVPCTRLRLLMRLHLGVSHRLLPHECLCLLLLLLLLRQLLLDSHPAGLLFHFCPVTMPPRRSRGRRTTWC